MIILKNARIGVNEHILVSWGKKEIRAMVLNAGEGTTSAKDDELFWLHAPAKDVEYSSHPDAENPPAVGTSFILAEIDTPRIPFTRLPQKVQVRKEGDEHAHSFLVTALVGLGRGGYYIYLEHRGADN